MGLLSALGGIGEQMVNIAQTNTARWDKEAQLALEEQKAMRIAEFTQGLHTKAADTERSRLASVAGSIPTEIDDPTHPEGKRKLTQVERDQLLADAYAKSGDVAYADKAADNVRQERRHGDEKEWRKDRALVEDKRAEEQARHARRMEEISAETASRQSKVAQIAIDEAAEKKKARDTVSGLIGAAGDVDTTQPGAAEAAKFYRGKADEAAADARKVLNIGAKTDPDAYRLAHDVSVANREAAKALELEAATIEKDQLATPADKAKAVALRAEAKALRKATGASFPEEADQGAKPAGLPKDAKQIGTSKGKPVYEGTDPATGQKKRYIAE